MLAKNGDPDQIPRFERLIRVCFVCLCEKTLDLYGLMFDNIYLQTYAKYSFFEANERVRETDRERETDRQREK